VTLGLGATVAAMTSTFPFLITLSQHKVWVFAFSAIMLALAGWAMYRPGRACPADAELGRACNRAMVWNRRIYWVSVGIWSIGFFAAYPAQGDVEPHVRRGIAQSHEARYVAVPAGLGLPAVEGA